MYCLIRMTSNDYADYLSIHKKIEYSYVKDGHESDPIPETLVQITQRFVKDEKSFLETFKDSRRELYFLKRHAQIQGMVELFFIDQLCYIHDFAVLKKREGIGTIFYQEILNLIKKHGAQAIEVWCPWEGGKSFWRKKGMLVKHGFYLWGKVE